MAHHRHAALHQKSDGLRHATAALELDGTAARFFHDPCRRHEGLLPGCFVGAERHVDHDEGVFGAAHHRQSLQDHHIEGDGYGGLQPVHHHAERVANEDEIAMPIEQPGGMRVIRCQTDDRLAAFARTDVGRGQTLDLLLCRHVKL